MSTLVSEDGLLTLPLYHGTSIYFWPSIGQHGLGAVDALATLRVPDLLRSSWDCVLEHAAPSLEDDPEMLSLYVPRMIEQSISAGGFNYRYGSVYVTLSKPKAISYASAGCGSELLTTTGKVLSLLSDNRPDLATNLRTEYSNAAAALTAEHRPILLELTAVQVDLLREETGEEIDSSLEDVEQLLSLGIPVQTSFELRGILHRRHIQPYEIADNGLLSPVNDL